MFCSAVSRDMIIEKQNHSLPVINYDFTITRKPSKHGSLLDGECLLAIIVGSSGSGKTNALISLILHPNGLRFTNLYVFSKTLFQPLYQYLKAVLAPLKCIGYYEYDSGENILPPTEAKINSVMIFDDIVCDNQSVMKGYFCFGRHRNIDSFYLSQTYSAIPKQLIRDNANFLELFKQDETNLKHVYDDHVNVDMPYQKFKEMCSLCWKEPYGFLVINKNCELNNGRYRQGFDRFIRLQQRTRDS